MGLEDAKKYKLAYQIVEREVKAERPANTPRWWQFDRPRPKLRAAIAPLSRYIAIGRHGKRLIAVWQATDVLPGDGINAVALDDDFSIGVISSAAHTAWAWQHSSTLKADLRYTPTTVWATFPWPDNPSTAQVEEVASASSDVFAARAHYCDAESIGLTDLYNTMDEGGFEKLAAHVRLDRAVADCYGWPVELAQDLPALSGFLLDLNREISGGTKPYAPPWEAVESTDQIALSDVGASGITD